jgi:hypothetical protein
MKQHIILFVIIASILILVITKSMIECASKWDDSYYTPVAGCMVKNSGGYVPEKNMIAIHWIEDSEAE